MPTRTRTHATYTSAGLPPNPALPSGGTSEPGILSLAASDIFSLLSSKKEQVESLPPPPPSTTTEPGTDGPNPTTTSSPPTFNYTVTAHFLEVYGEQVRIVGAIKYGLYFPRNNDELGGGWGGSLTNANGKWGG